MKKTFTFLLLISLCISGISLVSAQTGQNPKPLAAALKDPVPSFTVMFYNVENLYDTIDDPKIDDAEFLATGRIPWTGERYNHKLENLSKVFSSIVSPAMPDIIGMAEVENLGVLKDLIKEHSLTGTPYKIVHFDSPDERGIDVALLYNSATFKVTHSEAIPLVLGDDKTRDILYVSGTSNDGTKLHIFVNHWPSRREGAEVSEPKRIAAASVLREQLDKLFAADPKANIVIMGDFNDNPTDKSISTTLRALAPETEPKAGSLYSLLLPKFKAGKGSLYYKSWDLFDQLIVSGSLLIPGKGLDCKAESADIFSAKWLMFTTQNGEDRPNRTSGGKYYGGFSDHLPVFVIFR